MHLAARALEEARPCGALAAETADGIAAAHPLVRAILASACQRASRAPRHRGCVRSFGVWLTLSAFLAPPFSGLDTLPSLGVVIVGLGVLLRDLVLALLGALLGAIGVATILAIGSLVVETAQRWL